MYLCVLGLHSLKMVYKKLYHRGHEGSQRNATEVKANLTRLKGLLIPHVYVIGLRQELVAGHLGLCVFLRVTLCPLW